MTVKSIGLVLALVMATSTAYALTFTGTNKANDGVAKSKHNMNLYGETTKDPQGRVCAFCHTPHHALAGTAVANYMPLWSHALTTQTTYVPYASSTVGVDLTNELQGPTILCMSCHDGAIAIDEHYGNGLSLNKLVSDAFGGSAVGLAATGKTDLSGDHPVGFKYSDALALHTGDLNAENTLFASGTKKISDVLTDGYMTCATCHDVHNKDNVANTHSGVGVVNGNYFLYGDQKDSAFCLTCHNK